MSSFQQSILRREPVTTSPTPPHPPPPSWKTNLEWFASAEEHKLLLAYAFAEVGTCLASS